MEPWPVSSIPHHSWQGQMACSRASSSTSASTRGAFSASNTRDHPVTSRDNSRPKRCFAEAMRLEMRKQRFAIRPNGNRGTRTRGGRFPVRAPGLECEPAWPSSTEPHPNGKSLLRRHQVALAELLLPADVLRASCSPSTRKRRSIFQVPQTACFNASRPSWPPAAGRLAPLADHRSICSMVHRRSGSTCPVELVGQGRK